ncbi:MAG: hypothetical protein L3J29_07080 [Cyclobacteriaceae bacterium]|nr:hypothetical protein [Cyclobacteriaceae bacterium]
MKNNLSWKILKTFSSIDQDCFTTQDVIKKFEGTDKIYLSKVLSIMVNTGMLIKLNKGLYYIVPPSADAKNYIPDWHLVAKYLMQGRKYYIGYYSAMQLHGLITQPSLNEIIVTQFRSSISSKKIQGIEFQFVNHIKKRFFGFQSMWLNEYEKVTVSDLEKTIVDAVTKPQLCGGMIEVGKAIYETKNRIDLEKLSRYLVQNESHAATKRYLFITNIFDLKWTSYHEKLMQNSGNSYSVLDTSAPNEGVKNGEFKLKINLDINSIKNAIYT